MTGARCFLELRHASKSCNLSARLLLGQGYGGGNAREQK